MFETVGHFRKSSGAFPRKSNFCRGRKSHYPTQVGSYFASLLLETLWCLHGSTYTAVPRPGQVGRFGEGICEFPSISATRVHGHLEGELWLACSQRYRFPLCCWDPGRFYQVNRKAVDWIFFACTLGILEKCWDFWSLFCEVPSKDHILAISLWCLSLFWF